MKRKLISPKTIVPIENTHRAAVDANARMIKRNKALHRRTAGLAASNRSLKQGIIRRRAVEEELKKSGKRYAKLLEKSHRLQKRLRHVAHQVILAQEADRTKISHGLQDDIAQTLLGINVGLLNLKGAARGNVANLTKEIASTQRLVKDSVESINRFAHELRIHRHA